MNDKKILIIDDDERLLRAYEVKLSGMGAVVQTESDGNKALGAVKEFAPDLVVLDVLLPEKNGWDILKELKDDMYFRDIPVVMVSNIGSDDKEVEAEDAGAAAYLVKSDTPLANLSEIITEILSKNS